MMRLPPYATCRRTSRITSPGPCCGWRGRMTGHRWCSRRTNAPLSPPQNPPASAANSRATRKCEPRGQARFVKLRYTLLSLANVDAILDYIAAHSAQGARRVQARIQAIIELLLLHPGVGTRTDDPTIRRMTALPYRYLISTDTEIIIHAVRHASRDPAGIAGGSWSGSACNLRLALRSSILTRGYRRHARTAQLQSSMWQNVSASC